uniref:5'-3' DNA helicase ZGRF1-like N-terminal domain-containing protein n=1 Tax=Talaromyces marneffei PM1 TaxID=1077442 RepID=A0A093V6V2_TALMA
MSLPPSSFGRSTPSAVPASQNTAPVIKFRCLYTHDVRRKAKRWQDGYLKYHTFNKRAMVYDDAGNFIGDHHWQESHDIQDGDELELDKGVLIQVSECMETTQTDISVLFDKRKASQESPQQQKTPAPQSLPPPSSNILVSSSYAKQSPLPRAGRPFNPLKPLNDVLGIQRGAIGRSVMPQSPYEQCHRPQRPVERTQQDERPAKRPKPTPVSDVLQHKSANESIRGRSEVIDLDNVSFVKPLPKAAQVSNARGEAQKTADSPVASMKTIQTLSVQPTSRREQPGTEGQKPTNITRISSGNTRESISKQTSRREQPRPGAPTATNNPRIPSDRMREAPIEQTSWREQSRSIPQKPSAQPTPAQNASNVQASSTRSQALSEKSKSTINSNNVPINPLRISNEKPRQKLMYRALLPPKGPGEAQTNSNSTDDGDSLDHLDHDFPLSASTLAVLEESNPVASVNTHTVMGNMNNRDITSAQIQTPKVSRSQNSQRRLLNRIPTHASVYGPFASPAGVELHDDMRDDLALLLASSPLEPEHSDNEMLTTDQRTPVMRSNSDISHIVPEAASVKPALTECLARPSVTEACPTTAIKRSERVFRKSHSDTNALRDLGGASKALSRPLATTGPPRNERNIGTVKTESGPWTADALDFFDWWPPGHPMPA